MKYRLKQDLVIPAGKEFTLGPATIEYVLPTLEATIGFDPNHTGSLFVDSELMSNRELFEPID